jgi:hypothetical protein
MGYLNGDIEQDNSEQTEGEQKRRRVNEKGITYKDRQTHLVDH